MSPLPLPPPSSATGTAWRPWILPAALALAFGAGLATDALSAGRQVNLLAAPLLGVLVWNLLVYLVLLGRVVAGLLRRRTAGPGLMQRALLRGLARLPQTQAIAPGDAARAGALLHAASALFAVGLLAGLYLRGLAFEYRAGWESTFLDADGVRWLLGLVLGPASALTGLALPDAPALADLRFDAGPGERAARWIHLYAVSVALYVLVPRLLLALRGWQQAGAAEVRQASARMRPDSGSADRPASDDAPFASPRPGSATRVLALPYSYALPPACRRGLERLLATELGADCSLQIAPPARPEDDAPSTARTHAEGAPRNTAAGADGADLVLIVFTLSATPEPQTHVAFAAAQQGALAPGATLRVLVDESAFVTRFASLPQRITERRAAWRAAFAEIGIAPRFAALGQADGASP